MASRRVDIPKSVIENYGKTDGTAYDSFLSDSFIRGQDFTKLHSFHTPTHDVLHTPIVHSTEVKSKSLDTSLQDNSPPLLLFTPITSEKSKTNLLSQSSVDSSFATNTCTKSDGSSLDKNSRPSVYTVKMESLAKCSDFYGYPQDNGKKFLAEFESYADLHGFGTFDKRRLAAFHLHLKGPALTWYDSLENKSTWKTVHDEFTQKYVNLSGHGANMLMHSEIFQNLLLAPGQSIEDFYCQVYEKGKLINKPEHEMLSKFVSGLPHDVSYFVRAGMPKDMQTALASAKMAEAYGYRTHDDSVNAAGMFRPKRRDTTYDQNTEIQDLKKQVSELQQLLSEQRSNNSESHPTPNAPVSPKSEVAELKGQVQALTAMVSNMRVQNKPRQSHPNSGPSPRTRGPRHDFSDSSGMTYNMPSQNDTPSSNVRPGPNVQCFRCNGRRHYQRDCNWNGMEQSNPNDTCQLCMQQGHTANLCLTLSNMSGNMGNPGDGHGRSG